MARELSATSVLSLVVGGGLVAMLASGCFVDPHLGRKPARFHMGLNSRAVSVPTTTDDAPGATTSGAARSTTPSEPDVQHLSASSVAMQFTMATVSWLYSGVEAETGRLDLPHSNFAAAYGVVGTEQDVGVGSFGAELAAGWQGVRYTRGEEDHDSWVVEPRLRAQLWFAEQWTLGATVGARVADDVGDEWMAGAYLGVHSQRF